MLLIGFFGLIALLFALWRIGRRTRYFLHIAQLEGYKPGEYAAWVAGQPIGRIGQPDEVAALCLYLASDESAFATGAEFVIDGGSSL